MDLSKAFARLGAPLSFLAAALIAVPSSAWADGGATTAPLVVRDQIVVTADRLEKPAAEVGSSVTVITAEEIARKRKTTVAELLRSVPGLEVVRSGGAGQVTSVFIRGGNSSHTLVLVDGVRVNSATTGAFDFGDLRTDDVERIEIVRGPQSTLYGSEAVAGVISITTRHGRRGLHGSGAGELGDRAHRLARLAVDGGGDRFDFSVAASKTSTDAVSAAAERLGNAEDDPWENTTASARLGWTLDKDGRLDLTVRRFSGETAYDGYELAGPIDHLFAVQKRDATMAALQLSRSFGRRLAQTFALTFDDDDLEADDREDVFNTFAFDSRVAGFSSQSNVTLSKDDVLVLGTSVERREGGSPGSFEERVDLLSVYAQNDWSWHDRLTLTAGARWDDHSQYGGELTYRLSASWRPSAAWRVHASHGTGFRAPSLNDLYFPFYSNPDLEPETSRGFDLGVERRWAGGRAVVDVTFFSTDFDDLIAFDFVTFLPQNIARARARGVEATLTAELSRSLRLAVSHTWDDSENRLTGAPLARRPEHRSTLDLFVHPGTRFDGALSVIVVRDRIDSDGSVLDDYERVDLTAGWSLGERFRPYLRVENLFDQAYEEVRGFGTPGRVAAAGLELDF